MPPLQLRTRVLYVLLRFVGLERRRAWARRGRLRPLDRLLARGHVAIQHGHASGLLLDARAVPPTGAQAYGVLAGLHELQVQEALARSAGPGDVVWDIGANVGFTSLVAAHLVGPEGSVLAVEPDPACAALVRRNAELNGLAQLEVLEGAAAATTGPAEFVVVADPLWSRLAVVGAHERERGRTIVDAHALDDLDRPPPAVVKIDVEGAELEVIAGMRRLLREARPVVICEMHGKNAAFCDAMEAAGYVVRNLDAPGPVRTGDGNLHAVCEPAGA